MRWGVIGAASIATRSVMPAIQAADGNTLVAVASRSQITANAVAKAFGVQAYCSYQALLDQSDIDAVYIPLPNSLHFEWVCKALESGKHVLVEKSAFVTLNEAEHAVALARSKGLVIAENFQFQHHSQHGFVRQLLKDGAIGEVRGFRASFGFPPFGGDQNIRYRKDLGGGALLDSGAYTLKATTFLFGDDFELSASHMEYNEKYGVDWFGGAFLVNRQKKVFAEVSWGFDNFYQCNYEIWGSSGKLLVPRAYTPKADFSPVVLLENPAGITEHRLPSDDHFIAMVEYFSRIATVNSNANELEKILVQAKLIDAVLRCSKI